MNNYGELTSVKAVGLVTLLLLCFLKEDSMADCRPFFLDLAFGEPVPLEMVLDDLATARIIYVGEFHSISRHHTFQTGLLRDLATRDLKPALGLEMFTGEQQPALDEWQKGAAPLSGLIEALGNEHWTNLKDYEQLLLTARKMRIPIVGLNAGDRLVRKLSRGGIEALTEEEQRRIPEGTERINPLHDRLLRIKLKVHKAFQERTLDSIVLAQALRDETMARGILRFLDSEAGRDRIMLVVAGSGHLNYGFGIPERVERLSPLPYRIILATESGELVLSDTEKRQSVPLEITHKDLRFIPQRIADYLHVAPPKDEPETPSSDPQSPQARRW